MHDIDCSDIAEFFTKLLFFLFVFSLVHFTVHVWADSISAMQDSQWAIIEHRRLINATISMDWLSTRHSISGDKTRRLSLLPCDRNFLRFRPGVAFWLGKWICA